MYLRSNFHIVICFNLYCISTLLCICIEGNMEFALYVASLTILNVICYELLS